MRGGWDGNVNGDDGLGGRVKDGEMGRGDCVRR